jgi:hypothetical protein
MWCIHASEGYSFFSENKKYTQQNIYFYDFFKYSKLSEGLLL